MRSGGRLQGNCDHDYRTFLEKPIRRCVERWNSDRLRCALSAHRSDEKARRRAKVLRICGEQKAAVSRVLSATLMSFSFGDTTKFLIGYFDAGWLHGSTRRVLNRFGEHTCPSGPAG